jgi:hypothetical protein
MIRRAVGESCFESERYRIHRGYPGPPPSGNIPREATSHFAAGFGDVFFTHLHTQVRPKTEQASARSVPRFFLVVDLQRQEPPLAFEEEFAKLFKHLLLDSHLESQPICNL